MLCIRKKSSFYVTFIIHPPWFIQFIQTVYRRGYYMELLSIDLNGTAGLFESRGDVKGEWKIIEVMFVSKWSSNKLHILNDSRR